MQGSAASPGCCPSWGEAEVGTLGADPSFPPAGPGLAPVLIWEGSSIQARVKVRAGGLIYSLVPRINSWKENISFWLKALVLETSQPLCPVNLGTIYCSQPRQDPKVEIPGTGFFLRTN